MQKTLQPPDIVEAGPPLIFLAGPIQGSDKWREKAIKIIDELDPKITIASPERDFWSTGFVYEKQVDWETHYLREAAKQGVILFWLGKEAHHDCKRAYAQTSSFELAEWKVRHERDRVRIALGIEENFTNSHYIKRRFNQDCPDVPISDSLEETCEFAVKLLG